MDITVILPIHYIETQDFELVRKALDSFLENTKSYTHGTLKLLVITKESSLATVNSIVNATMKE